MNRREFLESAAWASALSTLPIAALAKTQSGSAFRASSGFDPATPSVQTMWEKPEFEVRALEIHSRRMWTWKAVETAFGLMKKMNMNTLIFHRDDLQTEVIGYEPPYFPHGTEYHGNVIQRSHTDSLYGSTTRDFMRVVVSEAKKRNIDVFLEICELEFPDGLSEVHPEIWGANGTYCPTTPFWWGYTRTKYDQLFNIIPDLAGIVVSPGTFESKLSISQGACQCASCKTTTPAEWYTNLIRSMYESIHKHGKTLVVRDFAYTKAAQNLVLNAAMRVSPDIVTALKTTPHDFYMTFPNNDRIGHVGSNRQWIEYDVWGQFYGMGLYPVGIVEFLQKHVQYARAHGAIGAQWRTDLEAMMEESDFNSFNLLNLIAGAMLSQNTTQDIDNTYRAWLQIGLLDSLIPETVEPPPVPIPEAYLGRLKDFMKASYAVALKAFYVRGFLFYRNGRFFDSVDTAFLNISRLGMQDWVPGVDKLIEPTDENIAAITAEKDEALAEVEKLPGILQVDSLPISAEFKANIATTLSLYRENVRGLRLVAIAIFRAKQASVTKDSVHAQQALKAADDLQQYRSEVATLLGNKYFPPSVHRAFDLYTLDHLIKNIRDISRPLSKAA